MLARACCIAAIRPLVQAMRPLLSCTFGTNGIYMCITVYARSPSSSLVQEWPVLGWQWDSLRAYLHICGFTRGCTFPCFGFPIAYLLRHIFSLYENMLCIADLRQTIRPDKCFLYVAKRTVRHRDDHAWCQQKMWNLISIWFVDSPTCFTDYSQNYNSSRSNKPFRIILIL